MPSHIHIRLLGDFRFARDGKLVTSLGGGRLQSLLAYLLLHREAPQSRQYVAFRLWPDSAERQARTNLRQLLHHLRKALPEADRYLQSDTQTLSWRPDVPLTLDVAAFEEAAVRAEGSSGEDARLALEEAVRWYRGSLLPSCYEEWIEPERERLHQLFVTTLTRLIHLQEERRDYRSAIETGHLLLQQDDLQEGAYRDLMRLYALDGNRAGALKIYQQCERVLERELGVKPAPLTQDIYERIRSASLEKPVSEGSTYHEARKWPLIGREQEWEKMLAAGQGAEEGSSRALFVEGEAGIGKTRLVEEFITWASTQGITTARAHCHPAEGRLAYAPVTEWLRTGAFRAGLTKLEAVWQTEAARVLPELLAGDPELPHPERMRQSWQRQHFFEALSRAVLSAPQPLILMIDDLQWCDGSTLEWLHFLLRFDPGAQLLLVGTVRDGEIGREHPLELLRLELRRSGQAADISLGPLGEEETAGLAREVAGRRLETEEARRLHRETEGNPLFVVEHVRAGLTAGHGRTGEEAGQGAVLLPPKVRAVISARLAQPSTIAQEVMAVAATIGRAFTFDLLLEASSQNEYDVVQALEELGRRRIVEERGEGSYVFSHEKLREVAYSQISSVRRRFLHRQIAGALERLHAEELGTVRGEVATHYGAAGQLERAIPHYHRAAEMARAVCADEEALGYLTRALALLERVPESREKQERELALLIAMGSSLTKAWGYTAPEMEQTYTRALALCTGLDSPGHLLPVLWGLWSYHTVRADLKKAHELGASLYELAGRQKDPVVVMASHFVLGSTLFHLGRLKSARRHLEAAIVHYDGSQHPAHDRLFGPDLGVFALAYLSHTLWHLGLPDRAVEASRKALERARQLAHPFSQAIALDYAAMLNQFLRLPDATRECADAAYTLSGEHGFTYYHGWATIMQGWVRAQGLALEEGIEQMARGLNALGERGAALRRPYYLGLLAEAHASAGRTEQGLALLAEAESVMAESGECWMAAELYRLRGELSGEAAGGEEHFLQALEAAGEARALALRAAASFSRLQSKQSGATGAHARLRSLYNEFAEGFDTPDLRAAAALLEARS